MRIRGIDSVEGDPVKARLAIILAQLKALHLGDVIGGVLSVFVEDGPEAAIAMAARAIRERTQVLSEVDSLGPCTARISLSTCHGLETVGNGLSTMDLGAAEFDFPITETDIKYIFALYEESTTPDGHMDHGEFAKRLWADSIGIDPEEAPEVYGDFVNDILYAYQKLDLSELLYDGMISRMDDIARILYENAERVILWSKGDCRATGFQPRKIVRSGIIKIFTDSVYRVAGSREVAGAFMRDRTGVMIADDKVEMAREYFLEKKACGQSHIRIVVIEDTSRNVEELRRIAVEVFDGKAEVVGMHCFYSRKAGKGTTILGLDRAIKSSAEISEIGDLASGAEVFIDFDGVLSDNQKSREWYARIFMMAIRRAQRKLSLIA